MCLLYGSNGSLIGLVICNVKQNAFNEIVERPVVSFGKLFKAFNEVNAKAEHCGFFQYCIHSAIICFANVMLIYITNKS